MPDRYLDVLGIADQFTEAMIVTALGASCGGHAAMIARNATG